MAIITLAQYIRNMGYRAYATLNDSALCIPLALQAGLGEVGRHGMLINEKHGPRFRIGKIFTDMPLEINKPRKFGVEDFCQTCDRWRHRTARLKRSRLIIQKIMPIVKAILKGVVKWTPSAEKCFKFWCNQNTDCIICIRSCPYNRDFSKLIHRIWLKIAKSPFKKLALKLDDWFMDRGRLKTSHWWRPELKKTEKTS